jgi:hypothetical protein
MELAQSLKWVYEAVRDRITLDLLTTFGGGLDVDRETNWVGDGIWIGEKDEERWKQTPARPLSTMSNSGQQ